MPQSNNAELADEDTNDIPESDGVAAPPEIPAAADSGTIDKDPGEFGNPSAQFKTEKDLFPGKVDPQLANIVGFVRDFGEMAVYGNGEGEGEILPADTAMALEAHFMTNRPYDDLSPESRAPLVKYIGARKDKPKEEDKTDKEEEK